MIVREYFTTRADGTRLYRTYSDQGYQILQVETGEKYDEAVDVENASHTYTETSDPIETFADQTSIQADELYA